MLKKLTALSTLIIIGVLVFSTITMVRIENSDRDLQPIAAVKDDRADRINAYFTSKNMPLAGYGKIFVDVADKNGIDWRLLPAISVKESSGGKYMCENNPFGWASCDITFNNLEEAINTVAINLGGKNPRTAPYYSGDTRSKLHSYNGTVEAGYEDRVIAIMEKF